MNNNYIQTKTKKKLNLNSKNNGHTERNCHYFQQTAIQLYSVPLFFFSNNEIDKSVVNLFCASRVAESKKIKMFENGRSYRPLFNCIACHYFFFKQRDRQKC